jgi:hypothetical protein
MNITTREKITPIAKKMARGIAPSRSEIKMLRETAGDTNDQTFKALLANSGSETTKRVLRQKGKDLLNAIGFATGRMLHNAVPGCTRPEKVKRWLRTGKLARLSKAKT